MNEFIGFVLGFIVAILLILSCDVVLINIGTNGQPNTVEFKETTYILVKAKIEEDRQHMPQGVK